jgi:hypothetical protein
MLSHRASVFLLVSEKSMRTPAFETAGRIDIRRWFQSTGGMRYDDVAWQPNLPDMREEAM